MNEQKNESIHQDKRGRMRLTVVRRPGQFGHKYSAIIYRRFKKADDADGDAVWEETHWMDDQDVLNSMRLHEVADDVIATARRQDAEQRFVHPEQSSGKPE